jgi:hypothetical protein
VGVLNGDGEHIQESLLRITILGDTEMLESEDRNHRHDHTQNEYAGF